jgi:hypothetical protein
MIALRITVNGKRSVVAAAQDVSVISATISLLGRLGTSTVIKRGRGSEFALHVGGLTSRPEEAPDEHLTWIDHRKMKRGDTVLIEIIETESASRVVRRDPAGGKTVSSGEREYYEEAKAVYFALKQKYEPES